MGTQCCLKHGITPDLDGAHVLVHDPALRHQRHWRGDAPWFMTAERLNAGTLHFFIELDNETRYQAKLNVDNVASKCVIVNGPLG